MKIAVITASASVDIAVEAMKRGASDYLTKPFAPAQVTLVANKLLELRALERKVAGLEHSIQKAAEILGLSAVTLWRRRDQYSSRDRLDGSPEASR